MVQEENKCLSVHTALVRCTQFHGLKWKRIVITYTPCEWNPLVLCLVSARCAVRTRNPFKLKMRGSIHRAIEDFFCVNYCQCRVKLVECGHFSDDDVV